METENQGSQEKRKYMQGNFSHSQMLYETEIFVKFVVRKRGTWLDTQVANITQNEDAPCLLIF